MPSYFALISGGSGCAECSPALVNKIQSCKWLDEAAWKRRGGQNLLALACTFDTTEALAKKRLQKELNQTHGTLGKQLASWSGLSIEKFRAGGAEFRSYFYDFELLKGQQCAIVIAPTPRAGEVDHYAVLGLNPGATTDEVRAAYRREALAWHPDKPTGDQARFVAVRDAYEAVTGHTPQLLGERQVLVAPEPNQAVESAIAATPAPHGNRVAAALGCPSLRDTVSVEDAEREYAKWSMYAATLNVELRKARDMMGLLSTAKEQHREAARRAAAQEYMQQFQKSARYWDQAELIKGWFRPDTYNHCIGGAKAPEEVCRNLVAYEKTWRPDLRRGNEDMDPFMRFDKFFIAGGGCNKQIRVTVGLDNDDAVDFGVTITLELIALRTYWPKLKAIGFDRELADGLHAEDAWAKLYARRRIGSPPETGMDLDVVSTHRLYSQLLEEIASEARRRKRAAETVDEPGQTRDDRFRQLAKRTRMKWDSEDESASQSSEHAH